MKNKMMRIASILMVAALLTVCAVSGTFAKYVTTGSASDTARVAKFGVSVTADGDTFGTSYLATTDDTVAPDGTEASAVTVLSEVKVVAPGTKGTLATVALAGIPEVDVRVTFALEAVKSTNWTVDGEEYFPLIFKVNGTEVAFDKLAEEVAKLTADYKAGTDLSTITLSGENANPKVEITWEWPFEVKTGEGDAATVDATIDAKDTWLGNQAAAGNPATVEFTLTATVTQID